MTVAAIAAGVILFRIISLLGVLFLGGLLLRHDVARVVAANSDRPYAASRIIDDLRPLQDTVAEFIAADGRSRRLLTFVSDGQPTRLRAQMTTAPERTATGLMILAVAGFVRLGPGGFRLTGSGRDIVERIRRRATRRL